eukprot:scaffold249394_cov51-Prasinocladus_malaysianus.AAC.2
MLSAVKSAMSASLSGGSPQRAGADGSAGSSPQKSDASELEVEGQGREDSASSLHSASFNSDDEAQSPTHSDGAQAALEAE